MRQITAIILTAALVLGFAACGNGNNSSNRISVPGGSESVNTKPEEVSESGDGNTVLTAAADAHNSQTLYLWEENKIKYIK